MSEKKMSKILLAVVTILMVVVIFLIGYIIYDKNFKKEEIIEKNDAVLRESDEVSQNIQKDEDYKVLYDGVEIEKKYELQYLDYIMKKNKEELSNYNIKYYNYENEQYLGETQGKAEMYLQDAYLVENTKKVAISNKYNAVPRQSKITTELPHQLIDMADYSSISIKDIDLDGDNKIEHILVWTYERSASDVEDNIPIAQSGVILFDSSYKKIADLVELKDGYWGYNYSEQDKILIKTDDIQCVDIDNDGIMEMIIEIPAFEGTRISLVKYNKGNITGQTNLEFNVGP